MNLYKNWKSVKVGDPIYLIEGHEIHVFKVHEIQKDEIEIIYLDQYGDFWASIIPRDKDKPCEYSLDEMNYSIFEMGFATPSKLFLREALKKIAESFKNTLTKQFNKL